MAQLTLDPELAQEASDKLTRILNTDMLEVAVAMRNAVIKIGEDTNIVEQFKEKFDRFRDQYNDSVVPAFESCRKAYDETCGLAIKMSKLQADTSVKAAATEDAGAEIAAVQNFADNF